MKSLPAAALAVLFCGSSWAADATTESSMPPNAQVYLRLADQTQACLQQQVLDEWFPASVDEKGGGFLEDFAEDWSPLPTRAKDVVFQSRLTWLAAEAAARDPSRAPQYLKIARHGLAFLADKQWDAKAGGFWWAVDHGWLAGPDAHHKHSYGNAFAIYAAANEYRVTHDPAALALAQKGFNWLDQHAHDDKNGGYLEALDAAGQPIQGQPGELDVIGAQYGQKSMNTHIHLLEALTALYPVWHDDKVRTRLAEVFDLCADKIYTDPGYLAQFLSADWQRAAGPDSFGHDIEAAYLLIEAADLLGKPQQDHAWDVGRKLVDHCLQYGWDREHGGLYDFGTPTGENLATGKIWWVQAESLNALLLMHERFGHETPRYWDAFVQQWDFISKYQIDHTHGGWYSMVRADGTPIPGRVKGDAWTEAYHQGRALINVTARLRRLAAAN